MTETVILKPGQLGLDDLLAIHRGGVQLQLDAAAAPVIAASAAVVQRAAEGDAPVYGVNTGFGKLANQRITDSLRRGFTFHIDVVHNGNRRCVKGNFFQFNRQLVSSRFHQRTVGRNTHWQRQRTFRARGFTGCTCTFNRFFMTRDNHLAWRVEVNR